jgi:glycosyltransferase involved in cell wall biosynthesis
VKNIITILHVIPTLEVGGAERQLALLCMEQARQGYAVHVAVRREGDFSCLIDSSRVCVHMIGNYPGLNPFLFFSLNRLIAKISPTIIQTWSTQMDIIGGTAALFSRIPWIATERTSLEFYNMHRRSFYNFLRRKIMSFSSTIIANSAEGAEMWKKISPYTPVFCVMNGVDFEGIKRITSSTDIVNGGSHVLMVGRLIDSKGFFQVVDAIPGLSNNLDLKFKIIGQGPLADDLIAQIEKLNLSERVQLIQDHSEWWAELRNAKLLISMSRFEGTPNVALETAASGCPILLSEIPAHQEIFNNDSAVFVELDNRYELIKAIEDLFGDYCGAKKRAIKAKEIVMKMSVVEMADLYGTIYEKFSEQ